METEKNVVIDTVDTSSRPLCLRCKRPEKRVDSREMCMGCVTFFCAWRRDGHPEGTVIQFIAEKPFTGSRSKRKGVAAIEEVPQKCSSSPEEKTSFYKNVCQRCGQLPKDPKKAKKGLCNSCTTSFYIWRKHSSSEGTVEEFIRAKPTRKWRAAAQVSVAIPAGNADRTETKDPVPSGIIDPQELNLSSVDLSRTISWVKCRACGGRAVLSPDRNLCFPCNGLFMKLEQQEGEITMERFLEWYRKSQESSITLASLPRNSPETKLPSLSFEQLVPGLLIGSEEMEYVAEMVRKVAPTNASVCIFGETGTGKELIAQAIHKLSPRARAPFVIVDCTSLSEKIAESELFGHAQGAFTGATSPTQGLLATADTGSIFFDELSVLDLGLQPKLLRVLEERHFRSVGKTAYRKIDIRVIAATNQSLEELVKQGRFREDLYHRFNVFPIEVPPLRERRKEIPMFVRYFLQQLQAGGTRVSQEVEAIFQGYQWPGNVRELRNVIIRALIMKGEEDRSIEAKDLPRGMRTAPLSRVA